MSTSNTEAKWICCQLGAREHYAIPRALFRAGSLDQLLTDAWVPPFSLLAKVCGSESKVAERFHNDLRDAKIKAFNSSLILFETFARVRRLNLWASVIGRNRWFQRKIVSALTSDISLQASDSLILLSYSYAALDPFRYAKKHGWKTVLLQIDPGPEEEAIVAQEVARVPELAGDWRPAPPDYWNNWREECDVADRIVVNSEWSREGLVRGGVSGKKISIIPLAYESPGDNGQPTEPRLQRKYPARFTQERPLRVLFLGLINLRKGIARLLEGARTLCNEPVEFWMVGPVEIANTAAIRNTKSVKWFGSATRKQASEYYEQADVFILPTLSDGFAITQLEAQAHGLPIIASKCCGNVVENGINGIILDETSAGCIAHALRNCIANPHGLEKFACASHVHNKFTIQALGHQLQDLAGTL
jgi:glycosyltransferase involved in cell wall biosynthesis